MEGKMKLVIQIKNTAPVELIDFAKGMISIGDEYREYCKENSTEHISDEAKLYIKKIRKGCIVAELIAMAPYALAFIEHSETVKGYAQHLKKVLDIFLGFSRDKPSMVEKHTMENLVDIVEPIAKDSSSQMNIAVVNINDPIFNIVFNSTQANAIQNGIRRELDRRKEPETGIKKEVLLYWVQTRGDTVTGAGNRGKIESIYTGSVKVRIKDDLKAKMVTGLAYPYKKAFIVDVDVQTIDGKPALYKVINLYDIIERDT